MIVFLKDCFKFTFQTVFLKDYSMITTFFFNTISQPLIQGLSLNHNLIIHFLFQLLLPPYYFRAFFLIISFKIRFNRLTIPEPRLNIFLIKESFPIKSLSLRKIVFFAIFLTIR